MEDGLFFSAILTSPAQVVVTLGSMTVTKTGAAGVNHWSVPFGGQTGVPSFKVVRDGVTVGSSANAAAVGSVTDLADGCVNYNAWVGSF